MLNTKNIKVMQTITEYYLDPKNDFNFIQPTAVYVVNLYIMVNQLNDTPELFYKLLDEINKIFKK